MSRFPQAPESFAPDGSSTIVGPNGQLAHEEAVRHLDRLQLTLHRVRDGVWSVVGNGLSNQSFVLGPEGLIVIDTGECVEEMQKALDLVRADTDAPVVAVIYTHFHYVNGTTAALAAAASGAGAGGTGGPVPIWAHERVPVNRRRMAGEAAPVMNRGVVHQFGVRLPAEGPDGLVSVGLGLFFRNPNHAPFTSGYVAPTTLISGSTRATIAGLAVEFEPAPSDADDSLTIWFPELGVCVNNLVWPTLFNVFAIRGEEYRDPRVLLRGLDHLLGLQPEYLVGAHGPPVIGADEIRAGVTDYRDSIQFLWDQTVRGLNKGLTGPELSSFVQFPSRFERTHLTREYYGLAEHHVRQIQAGMIGWFDGREDTLFPVPEAERATRLIAGFGGREVVRKQALEALQADDLRWALELSTWLVRSELDATGRADGGSAEDRSQLAAVLRTIAQRTSAANLRNWCLTRALELEGVINLTKQRTHTFRVPEVLNAPVETYVHVLRVLLDPAKSEGLDTEIRFDFGDAGASGLRVRGGVAVPTDGAHADVVLALAHSTWAQILAGTVTVDQAMSAGDLTVSSGAPDLARRALAAFDHPSFS